MSLPTFKFETSAEEVATVFADQIKGKNVLITGTSLNGIGYETARVIAKYANLVIITGYNSERLKLTQEAIKKELPQANIRLLTLDLSSFNAVRQAAAEVNAYSEPIHVLINNAAASPSISEASVDGFENQLATNHLGPFLFTNLILPKILATKTEAYTPRIVFVSSSGHAYGAGVDLENLENHDPKKYKDLPAYFVTKSANILTAIELSRRFKGRINAYSLHPGVIDTNMQHKEGIAELMKGLGVLNADGTPNTEDFHWKTIGQGAATQVAAAFDTRFEDKAGAYLDDSNDATTSIAPHSSDPVIAEKLWVISEKLVGLTSPQ